MVSVLWKACSEGNLDQVHALLAEASAVDVEIKGMFDMRYAHMVDRVFTYLFNIVLLLRSYRCDTTHRSSEAGSY